MFLLKEGKRKISFIMFIDIISNIRHGQNTNNTFSETKQHDKRTLTITYHNYAKHDKGDHHTRAKNIVK